MGRVFLDCGHGPKNGKGGAFDEGATANGETEYRLVSRILQGKEQAFRDQRPSVVRTPEDSIQGVVKWVNARVVGAEIGEVVDGSDPVPSVLLAVHLNSSDNKKASGTEVVYSSSGPPERKAQAEKIAAFVAKELGLVSRGAVADDTTPNGKPKLNGNRGLPLLRDTACPAFILELGFISNRNDLERIGRKGGLAVAELIRWLGKGGLEL